MASNSDYEEDAAKMAEDFETAETVYQTVSQEFYAWKADHVAKVFTALPHSATSSVAKQTRLPPAFFEPLPRPTRGDSNVMLVYSYSSDGSIVKSESVGMTVHTDLLEKSECFPPHPPYRYCTSASRSENGRMHDSKDAPFVPFPEDPAFPRSEYLSHFQNLQWKDDQRDPDEEVIQYETVRRWHISYRFTADLIGAAIERLNFRPLRLSNESGLLWDISQRDLPDVVWADGLPYSSKKRPQLPPYFGQEPLEPGDLFEQINRNLGMFCPNLNCIQNNCHVHVDYQWQQLRTPCLKPKQAHLTSEILYTLAEAACGNECFLIVPEDAMEDVSADDVPLSDQSVLRSMLKLEPDILPCDLAVICRIPCRIVRAFVFRTQAILDEDVLPDRRPKKTKKSKLNIDFSGNVTEVLEFKPGPCVHTGPCSSAQCDCFKLRRYCERNCRCEDDCVRRWSGCNSTCKLNPHCCDSSRRTKNRCKCRLEGRECDPEKCTVCGARNQNTRCTNVSLQLGKFKRFEIRKSPHGLGAFTLETVKKGDLIGEYVGELLDEADIHHREVIQKHSRLNYCFDIMGFPPGISDAQWLGNPTRFLNDPKPAPRANCEAYEVIVNGESRIVIRAQRKIMRGAELTLSYGEKYWNQGTEQREEEENRED